MGKAGPIDHPRRGEIYLVDFDPTRGAEIRKQRPAVIIQNDIGNRNSSITIVAVITSTIPPKCYPFQVLLRAPEGGLGSDSVVLLNQIRSVDRLRLFHCLGKLPPRTMARVDKALEISLGLVAL